MSMKIKYRKFHILDSFKIAYILSNEWNLGCLQTKLPKIVCGLRYLFASLLCSHKSYVAVYNFNVLGIICIRYPNKEDNQWYTYLFNLCEKNIFWDKRKAFQEYDNQYSYIENKCDEIADTVLELFIVDKKYRGFGVGKSLLDIGLSQAKTSISVSTDTNCNYQFYLHNGFEIIESKELDAGFEFKVSEDDLEIDYLLRRRL